MQNLFTLIDTHPAIAYLILFGSVVALLYILKLYDKDQSEPNHTDRYRSPKP